MNTNQIDPIDQQPKDEGHEISHVSPVSELFIIFGILLVLTITTALIAYVDLGPMNVWVALLIAVIKATLVILYFMHAKYVSGITKIYVGAAFFWLGIMLFLTMTDYITRGWIPLSGTW